MKRSFVLASLFVLSFSAFAQTDAVISEIKPTDGPSHGGTAVTIIGAGFQREVDCLLPCPTTVTFGGIEVPVKLASPTSILAIAPAHEPGPVDLTVNIAGKAPATKTAAFTFLPGKEDDYERVLLPIYLESAVGGAFGSRWKTDFWMRNNGVEPVALGAWPCAAEVCADEFPMTYPFEGGRSLRNLPALGGSDGNPSDGNPSRMLYVERELASRVAFSLRFADVSRASLDGGVEMPVVRQSEMLGGPAQLFDVPLGPTFRVLLRIYEVAYAKSTFRVTVYPQSETDEALVYSGELTAISPSSAEEFRPKAGYAYLDISGLLRNATSWPASARIEIAPLTPGSRFWAFASITNNDTQVVTLVTPQ
jgi:hypothetical protein